MSNAPRGRSRSRRGQQSKPPAPVDLWHPAEPLPDVEPIVVPAEVGTLLKSLGDPPSIGRGDAGHYFTAVVERAAALAAALALSADLLAEAPDD